jgi:creatinine amidohydrolase
MKAGKRSVIVPTGGVEPNGPWLALGKHNYVLQSNCEAIARKLGNALCAPIVKFVPEGDYTKKTGHMASPGTITMREETFRAILEDVARSLQAHGFDNIIFIGDSGGNQEGQLAVAEKLNTEWSGRTVVAHIPEYYDYPGIAKHFADAGLIRDAKSEHMHDDPIISLNMFNTDPNSIRYEPRVKAAKASINGIDLSNRAKSAELAKEIVNYRAGVTVAAIRKAISNKGKRTASAGQ